MVASADYTQGLWINNCAEKSILSHGSLHKYTYTQSAIEEFGSAGGTAKSKSCDEKLDRVNTVQFYWQPNTCALQPFEEKQMRQILKDHRILMVGDSLMGQMWESMQLLSGMDVPYHKSYMLVNHKTLFPMDHSDVMECRRLREWVISDGADSDEISATRYAWMNATEGQLWEDICPTFTSKQYHRETSTLDWTYKLADTDVLVLATGHHFQKEDRTLSKAFPQMIKNLIKYLRRIKYTGKIIVSTAPPGHENCDEYRVPISKTPAPVPTEYHWEGITAVEFLWNETFHKSSLRDNFYILNVTFSDLRPDAHFSQGDCLHYCSAGVPDSWVHALYNLLLQVLY
ncbi:hypothetical protein SARC_06657 [Sphaeroforma arctica JP610]|uniref:Trichome birefringence-like C-terminal domain-containing protein n=1 Tax=Sphaeroforma arctica JP610 TaxID=667725 RepID=A0A0L0FVY3_9EUKA|nr:hypothetical protein SARC_06657 [Sphaeroforma arctica JP610]KNC80997.1 hypothetical protein SARC_06657 [Sphaeroforma arctica JP610]|eukprot:XP_014154899.1 hypothetical protein SARC_06657 [Sphaeroforma arctica JP610]